MPRRLRSSSRPTGVVRVSASEFVLLNSRGVAFDGEAVEGVGERKEAEVGGKRDKKGRRERGRWCTQLWQRWGRLSTPTHRAPRSL